MDTYEKRTEPMDVEGYVLESHREGKERTTQKILMGRSGRDDREQKTEGRTARGNRHMKEAATVGEILINKKRFNDLLSIVYNCSII